MSNLIKLNSNATTIKPYQFTLKPCPFCGSEPSLIQTQYLSFYVQCQNKYCIAETRAFETNLDDTNKKMAIDVWNKRSQ